MYNMKKFAVFNATQQQLKKQIIKSNSTRHHIPSPFLFLQRRHYSNPNILASLVDANNIQTWKSQQVILKPNEACAFIIDGRIGDIISEKIVRNVGGGLGRFIGDMMGATATDRRLLFAMTGPADISIPFSSNLNDGSKVQGFANLRVQIRDDDIGWYHYYCTYS